MLLEVLKRASSKSACLSVRRKSAISQKFQFFTDWFRGDGKYLLLFVSIYSLVIAWGVIHESSRKSQHKIYKSALLYILNNGFGALFVRPTDMHKAVIS